MMKTLAWIAFGLLVASGLYAQAISFIATHSSFSPVAPASTWLMDEGTGQTAADSSGSFNCQLGATTGSEASDPTWVASGLEFDGGDHLRCGTSTYDHDTNDPWSMSAIVRTDVTSQQDIMGKAKNGNFWEGYVMYIEGGPYFAMGATNNYNSNNYAGERATSAQSTATWYHLLVAYDGVSYGVSGMTIYINGSAVATTTVRDTLSSTPVAPTAYEYTFGSRSGSFSLNLDGIIGVGRHWTVALDADNAAYWCNQDETIMSGRSVTAPAAGCAAAP